MLKKDISMNITELKKKVLETLKDKKEAKAIISSIDKNPKEYEKYLTMSRPLDELLADWA